MDDTQCTGWQKRILLFLTSQCITLFGSTLVQMALVWYATMQTASGVWVAAFTVSPYLPQFLISFIGGVWADRDYHDATGENRYFYASTCLWLTGNQIRKQRIKLRAGFLCLY